MVRALYIFMLLCCSSIIRAEAAEYGVALTATPVLNSHAFTSVFGGNSGKELKTDRCGQVRELEYIALPGTVFTIFKKMRLGNSAIFQVTTDEYPAPPNVKLYVDGRFLKTEPSAPAHRKTSLPSLEAIIAALRASVGSHYVWGGNVPNGVPELAEWFYKGVSADSRGRLTLSGLDCSGLLYHATGGWTPRNSSQLISFGKGVTILGKKSAEIARLLQPLDLIVWNGHVIIVLDRETVIESRLECGKPGNGGVVMTPLPRRIEEIMRTRRPVNAWPEGKRHQDVFVIRRWYSQ